MRLLTAMAVTALLLGGSLSAQAREYPIGELQTRDGLEIAAVYLQPIEMDPPGMMRAAAQSDIHLEADIHATQDNRNGFAQDAWLPYLVVRYELSKLGGPDVLKGDLMPMVAADGPHYGDNLKLMGPGKYKLRLTILPPSENHTAHFGRHVDRETGVEPWFKPITVDYEFTFAGTGKKGAY
ncbi:MAG TPA: iron transporter [Ferrovibrio sp.]|uniref:iron transporter n=1 Tax=Ferrovibrio sp. TaxID=1917215 RepID=UPI002ED149D9